MENLRYGQENDDTPRRTDGGRSLPNTTGSRETSGESESPADRSRLDDICGSTSPGRRAAPAWRGSLVDGPRARAADPPTAERTRSPAERVLDALADATAPLTRRELRDICRLRNATLVDTLAALQADGRVQFEAGHVQLALG